MFKTSIFKNRHQILTSNKTRQLVPVLDSTSVGINSTSVCTNSISDGINSTSVGIHTTIIGR